MKLDNSNNADGETVLSYENAAASPEPQAGSEKCGEASFIPLLGVCSKPKGHEGYHTASDGISAHSWPCAAAAPRPIGDFGQQLQEAINGFRGTTNEKVIAGLEVALEMWLASLRTGPGPEVEKQMVKAITNCPHLNEVFKHLRDGEPTYAAHIIVETLRAFFPSVDAPHPMIQTIAASIRNQHHASYETCTACDGLERLLASVLNEPKFDADKAAREIAKLMVDLNAQTSKEAAELSVLAILRSCGDRGREG